MILRRLRRLSLCSVLLAGCGAIAACDEPGGRGTPVAVSDTTGGDVTPDETVGDTVTPDSETTSPDTSNNSGTTNPTCVDGQWDEVVPNDKADITALVAGYSEANYLAFADQVLAQRYPFGRFLVSEANAGGAGGLGNCITAFARNRGRARDLIGSLSTVVHECGHIYDLDRGSFGSDSYRFSDDVSFECDSGDTTTRGGDTFARSRLNDDVFAPMWPDDNYRDVYLDGNPDDATFDGGDQGFNSVLEEATQYINSLVVEWTFRDQSSFTISARDGILTFLWYTERYLHMARDQFPNAYARITGDACWREAILTMWGRAWLYLDLTKDIRQLGIDDDAIEALVLLPELLHEIELLRDLHGCR